MGRVWFCLIVVWTAILVGCAEIPLNNVTVLVTGVGTTAEEARRAAFRDAVQLAYGSLNLSERRVVEDKLFEDDVSYARGVIDSFREISRTVDPKDGLHRIHMSVTVSPTAIERRLLASQDSRAVSGNEIRRQIDKGQQQIRSEIDRDIAARRLFEHVAKGMATKLFDVKAGQVETVRNGSKISNIVEVTVSINAKMLQSLCAATKEYERARTEELPTRKYKMGYLSIQHAYDCSVEADVDPILLEHIAQDLNNLGICLNLEDGAGQRLGRIFYKPQSPHLVNPAIRYDGPYIDRGAYLFRGYYNRDEYQLVIILVRKAWGNDETFRLELPNMSGPQLQRLSKITAVLSTHEGCA